MNHNNVNGNNLPQVSNGKFDIFNYKNLGSVRCYIDQQGVKWFCHNDVCGILGMVDPHVAKRRLDPKGVCSIPVLTNGGMQNANFINEGNLFRLITGSKKDEAQEFTNWVCDVVLPNLMNKGYYIMANGNISMSKVVNQIGQVLEVMEQQMDERFKQTNVRIDNHNERIVYLEEFNNQGYYTLEYFLGRFGFDSRTMSLNDIEKDLKDTCRKNNYAIARVYSGTRTGMLMYPYGILVEVLSKYNLGIN